MKIKMLKTMAGPNIPPRAAESIYVVEDAEAKKLIKSGLAEAIDAPPKPEYTTATLPEPDNAAGPKLELDGMTKDELIRFAVSEGIPLNTAQRQSKKSYIIEHIQRIVNG